MAIALNNFGIQNISLYVTKYHSNDDVCEIHGRLIVGLFSFPLQASVSFSDER